MLTTTVTAEEIQVRFAKRAHNPILKEAGSAKLTAPVPWLQQKLVRPFSHKSRC